MASEVIPFKTKDGLTLGYRAELLALPCEVWFCRKVAFEAICGMISRHDQQSTMGEHDDGSQLQRGPFPTGYHPDGRALVCGECAVKAACKNVKTAPIMASATLYSPSYPAARCGGLRGAGGISTDAKIAANIERGFCPKNRSAAVVPSGRVRQKLCTAVRHSRFLGCSSPRS